MKEGPEKKREKKSPSLNHVQEALNILTCIETFQISLTVQRNQRGCFSQSHCQRCCLASHRPSNKQINQTFKGDFQGGLVQEGQEKGNLGPATSQGPLTLPDRYNLHPHTCMHFTEGHRAMISPRLVTGQRASRAQSSCPTHLLLPRSTFTDHLPLPSS